MANPSVNIGFRKRRVFIISTYAPGPGTYVDKEPVLEATPYDIESIGSKVLEGLKNFVDGGEIPNWDTYRSPVLDAVSVSSWSEYERGLKECVVVQHEDHFHFMTELPHIRLPRDATLEDIGNAILKALGTSKEKELKRAKK